MIIVGSQILIGISTHAKSFIVNHAEVSLLASNVFVTVYGELTQQVTMHTRV